MKNKYRVKIILQGDMDRTIKVDFPNFALATQLAEQVASSGYTQQLNEVLWEHYIPNDIKAIYIERIPNKDVPVAQQD